MLSLIQAETVVITNGFSSAEFTNIVAISQMTPGPISINAATYSAIRPPTMQGLTRGWPMLGSATATFALVLPSFYLNDTY